MTSEPDSDKEKSGCRNGFLCKMSWTQRLMFCTIGWTYFIEYSLLSILGPFFPTEAGNKGVPSTVVGLIFGCYALTSFVACPIWGVFIPKLGVKNVLLFCLLLTGTSTIAFGLLNRINDPITFVALCFTTRIIEGIGTAGYLTGAYAVIASTFPKDLGVAAGLLETFIGVALCAGPAVGGGLYALGGYGLPFYVIGGTILVNIIFNLWLIPESEGVLERGRIGPFIRNPNIVVTLAVVFVAGIVNSFLMPTLEPHLEEFNIQPEYISFFFLFFGITYALTSPLFGWIAGRTDLPWTQISVGLVGTIISLLLLGPSPLLPFLPSVLWLNGVSLLMWGLFFAMTFMPTFPFVLKFAISSGAEDTLTTHSTVSGLWTSSFSLGEMTGPLLGGALLQYFGFPVCSTAIAGIVLTMLVVVLVYWTFFPYNEKAAQYEKCKGFHGKSDITDIGIQSLSKTAIY